MVRTPLRSSFSPPPTSGVTWTDRTVPTMTTNLDSVSCSSTTDCVAVRPRSPSSPPPTAESAWTAQTPPSGAEWFAGVSCASTADCVIVGGLSSHTPGVVLTAANGGGTWTSQTARSPERTPSGACRVRRPPIAAAVGTGTASPLLATTTDGGTSWMNQAAPNGVHGMLRIACPSTTKLCRGRDLHGRRCRHSERHGAQHTDSHADRQGVLGGRVGRRVVFAFGSATSSTVRWVASR